MASRMFTSKRCMTSGVTSGSISQAPRQCVQSVRARSNNNNRSSGSNGDGGDKKEGGSWWKNMLDFEAWAPRSSRMWRLNQYDYESSTGSDDDSGEQCAWALG